MILDQIVIWRAESSKVEGRTYGMVVSLKARPAGYDGRTSPVSLSEWA